MKKTTVSLILFSFLLISNICTKAFNEGEIVITNISLRCIDTTYVASKRQERSINGQTKYEIGQFIYELKVSIELFGDGLTYSKPIALTVFIPNERIRTIIVNQELNEMRTENVYDFIIIIKTKEKGWSKISIEAWDDENVRAIPFNGINARDRSFSIL